MVDRVTLAHTLTKLNGNANKFSLKVIPNNYGVNFE